MKIDKQNGDMCFNEETHSYFSLSAPDRKYISVTTLLTRFEPPFDKEFWSAYKAVEKLIRPGLWSTAKAGLLRLHRCDEKLLDAFDISVTEFVKVQNAILDDWEQENKKSTDRGSGIHAGLEESFYRNKKDISLEKYGLGGRFECGEGNPVLDNGVYPEYLIHYDSADGKVHLAGQIDLLVKEGSQFSIVDWKGLPLDTPIPTPSGWRTMGDLQEGDMVYDSHGMPCRVLHMSEVHHNPCKRIRFTNGEEVVCDHEHRWLVTDTAGHEAVMDAETLQHSRKIWRIRKAGPLQGDMACAEEPLPGWGREAYIRKAWADSLLRGEFEPGRRVIYQGGYRTLASRGYRHAPDAGNRDRAWQLRAAGHIVHEEADGSLWVEDPDSSIRTDDAWTIQEVEDTETVATRCMEVDSDDHTYLCTKHLIPTHNTNKKIQTKSYRDPRTGKTERLKYPLADLDNCNYNIYNLQLSTYAYMVEQQYPEWTCRELRLVHFNHEGVMNVYKMEYLKDHVRRMLRHWAKIAVQEQRRMQRKPIEY